MSRNKSFIRSRIRPIDQFVKSLLAKHRAELAQGVAATVVAPAMTALVLVFLELVLCNAADYGATDSAQEAVIGLMACEPTSKTAGYRTTEATIAFLSWCALLVVSLPK